MLTKSDLSQFRKIVREEVETESKTTRNELQVEMKLSRMKIEERLSDIENKTKDLVIKADRNEESIKRIVKIEHHLGISSQ